MVMSSSMLVVRTMGMVANIYITSLAGAEAMGVYHMILSVFTFGITLSSSGTGFAATRLVAEGRGDRGDIIKKCLAASLVMSLVGFAGFRCMGEYIAELFIPVEGAGGALRILAFALPCMGFSGVLRGYFIAKRRAWILTAGSILEEGVSIASTLVLLTYGRIPPFMCPVWGCALSNGLALVFDLVCYLWASPKDLCKKGKVRLRDIADLCIPVALGSYLRTSLVTIENLLIPMQFQAFGIANPPEEYGLIKAMAMPVIMFPTVFIQAFSSMLVPELSEMHAGGRPNGVRHVSELALEVTTMFAFFAALMLFKHHEVIGNALYKNPGVTRYLGMLSLLAIPMYPDTVADSILKGLDMQNAVLRYNIIDSILRVTAIFLVLPRVGPVFYILLIYISEILNLALSLGKASAVAGVKLCPLKLVAKPLVCALTAGMLSSPPAQAICYICIYLLSRCVNIRIRPNQLK